MASKARKRDYAFSCWNDAFFLDIPSHLPTFIQLEGPANLFRRSRVFFPPFIPLWSFILLLQPYSFLKNGCSEMNEGQLYCWHRRCRFLFQSIHSWEDIQLWSNGWSKNCYKYDLLLNLHSVEVKDLHGVIGMITAFSSKSAINTQPFSFMTIGFKKSSYQRELWPTVLISTTVLLPSLELMLCIGLPSYWSGKLHIPSLQHMLEDLN